jgi:anti-sigma factor RsiW
VSGEDLTCKEVVEIVSDYLEGALSAEDRARFDAHLTVCDGCHTYVEQMRETIAAGTFEPFRQKVLEVWT